MIKSPGKAIRLRKIFQADQHTVIIPLDHGMESGPVAGFEYAEKTLSDMISAGADAILTSFGAIAHYADLLGQVGLILRLDGGETVYSVDVEDVELMYRVEDAVRLGADAVVVNGYVGGPHMKTSFARIGAVASACAAWQVPLMVEMFMGGSVKVSPENVAMAARVAAELGADVVKTHLAGDAQAYRNVVERTFAPVVILGGEKTNDKLAVLHWAKTAVDAGAAGTCIGRNVWQHSNPQGVVRALRAIVHEGASIEQASELIERR